MEETKTTTIDFDRLGANLRYLYVTAQGLVHKKAELAWSRFLGACDAACAVGIGMTPFAVQLAVQDTINERSPRPAYDAFSNSAQVAWDEEANEAVAARLRAL